MSKFVIIGTIILHIKYALTYSRLPLMHCIVNLSIGTEDYKKTLNMDAWLYCYTTKCCKPPPLYPKEFDVAATSILNHDLHMEKRDITADHAKLVYLHLLSKFTSD